VGSVSQPGPPVGDRPVSWGFLKTDNYHKLYIKLALIQLEKQAVFHACFLYGEKVVLEINIRSIVLTLCKFGI